jgi:bifunctional non-homologous end joining protein LigD
VPKGLPEYPGEKRLAITVADHPLDYIGFEGTIPTGDYGAGDVKISDNGTYEPIAWKPDRIEVILHGSRLSGKYTLVRFRRVGDKEWLVLRAKA